MRLLILGGDGMLGHQLLRSLAPRHDARATLRREVGAYAQYGLFTKESAYGGVDALRQETVLQVLADFRPEAVVNAIGIVKQRGLAHEAIPSLEVNALFPHRLALACRTAGARLVHMSTDCVFSGRKGSYTEADPSDATDLYGRTKYLGEVAEPHCLTLRTSIIGLELAHKASLVEWFLSQRGPVRGFRRAVYCGLTTREMARVIEKILVDHPGLSGVIHVASAPITKYDLLKQLARRTGRDVRIDADDTFACDRSLRADAFEAATGYRAPSWDEMLVELAEEIRAREGGR